MRDLGQAEHLPVFEEQPEEDFQPTINHLRHFQQPDQVPGRGGVEHEGMVTALFEALHGLGEGDDFVQAGRREVEDLFHGFPVKGQVHAGTERVEE